MSENRRSIKGEYERDLHHSWLNLETEVVYEEDYQMRMLKSNHTKRLLKVVGQGREEKSRYRYEVSGKMSVEASYESAEIKYRDMEIFMKQFIEALQELENLLLNPNGLVLEPAFIYKDKENFYFCFCPSKDGDIWEGFHRLTEYFVKRADYQDKDGVYLAYELHKASMEENYNIEAVLEEIMEKREAEIENIYKIKERGYEIEEDTWLDDWESEQELGSSGMKDKKSVWGMVGEKMRRKKKKAWGEWEGIEM